MTPTPISPATPWWQTIVVTLVNIAAGALVNHYLGPAGIAPTFPTIFGVLREQRPGAEIATFHQWQGFARLVEPSAPSVIENGGDAADTVKRAVAYLATHKPDLLFVHLDNIDDALHHEGHLTPAYLAAIAEADRLTGLLLAALDRNGMRAQTVVLLTADHGGRGKGHGGESMQELEIPWILSGPGVRRGELRMPVNTFDTAATLAHILGLKPPPCWTGRPVAEALP